MNVTSKKRSLLWLHVIITLLLMFGFGMLPCIGPVTPLGMKLLGVFLGLVYSWTACGLLWPSLLGIAAIGLLDIMPMSEFAKESFGNSTVVFILFIFVIVSAIEEAGLVAWLGNWFMSRKINFGRPWFMTFMLLFGAYVAGTLVNEFAAILIFWSIYFSIAKRCGYKPYDKYSTLMVIGIMICGGTAATSTLPFKIGPLIWLSAYTQMTGENVNFSQYLLFSLPVACLTVVVYVLIMKFIFRPDVSNLAKIDETFINKNDLKLSKYQKTAFLFLMIYVLLLLIPGMLPESWIITKMMSNISYAGISLLIIVAMMLVKIDGRPMLEFKKMTKGISWDMYALFAIVMPLSSLMTADNTGISELMVNLMGPIVSGHSPLIFALLILLTGTIITNVANNGVLGVIYVSLMCPVAASMSIDALPIVAVMVFTIQLAYLTPAASAPAALVFGNTEWVKAKDVIKYSAVIIAVLFVFYFVIALPFANLVF